MKNILALLAFMIVGSASAQEAKINATWQITPPPQILVNGTLKGQLVFYDDFSNFVINKPNRGGTWYSKLWTDWVDGLAVGTVTAVPGGPGIRLTSNSGGLLDVVSHPIDALMGPITNFKYGYYEASIRLSTTTGNIANSYVAFWLQSRQHIEQQSYSTMQGGLGVIEQWCEIDVVEGGQGHNKTVNTVHSFFNPWPATLATAANVQNSNNVNSVPNDPLDGNCHTYGVLWIANSISWYMDNVLIAAANTGNGTNSYPICNSNDMEIILGIMSSTHADQQIADYQWVRVWQ